MEVNAIDWARMQGIVIQHVRSNVVECGNQKLTLQSFPTSVGALIGARTNFFHIPAPGLDTPHGEAISVRGYGSQAQSWEFTIPPKSQGFARQHLTSAESRITYVTSSTI